MGVDAAARVLLGVFLVDHAPVSFVDGRVWWPRIRVHEAALPAADDASVGVKTVCRRREITQLLGADTDWPVVQNPKVIPTAQVAED
jgi:hypothetical protein